MDTCTLAGLPGIRKKMVKAAWAKTPSGFIAALARHRAVTAAGDDGAVNAYRDDAGNYRAHFSRHWSILSEETFASKAALRRWLEEWLPKMREFH